MKNISQRIEELRTAKGMSRPALAAELGFPKMSVDKFETGRITPTKEQQQKLAAFFAVSPAYLRGETDDPSSSDNWLSGNLPKEPEPTPPPKTAVVARFAGEGKDDGAVFAALLKSDSFRALIRESVLDVLRSSEGQEIMTKLIKKELNK